MASDREMRSQGSEISPADAQKNIESAVGSELDRQPGPSLRTSTSQDPTPVFRAHALSETVLAFLLEIRWLLKCKGHGNPPLTIIKKRTTLNERCIIGAALRPVNFQSSMTLVISTIEFLC